MQGAIALAVLFPLLLPTAFAQVDIELYTDSSVYTENRPLFVHGIAQPNEGVIVRLSAPDGIILVFDQITADDEGLFSHVLFVWPEPTAAVPFGTYTVEAIASGKSSIIDIKFAADLELVEVPIVRQISTSVFVPDTSALGAPLRVFVQTTSDGLLVAGDPAKILRASHVHLPDGNTVSLSSKFRALHQGLYYVDYTPELLGTHVFHTVAFHQGTASHGSAVTTVLGSDIGEISERIIDLDDVLVQTSDDLDRLKSEIGAFGSLLEDANTGIDESVTSMRSSVTNIESASSQLNSLFFPIIAFIGIIVALQLVILARHR